MTVIFRSSLLAAAASLAASLLATAPVHARAASASSAPAPSTEASASGVAGADLLLDARDAFRRNDGVRLAVDRAAASAAQLPLAMWVDYWELNNRLASARQDDLNDFYRRWPGTYVEDRLRNDWLLELGRRRDWTDFAAEYPKFRMNDDREVSCYATLLKQQAGEDVREEARRLWFAQREFDDGCSLLASTLSDARQFTSTDLWMKARLATEAGKGAVARFAAGLANDTASTTVAEIFENPQRYLARRADASTRTGSELVALALIRLAAKDPEAAAQQIEQRWRTRLLPPTLAWVWASVARQAAIKLMPQADGWFRKGEEVPRAAGVDLPDDTLAWKVRAALRADDATGADRWQRVIQAIDAMSPAMRSDSTWVYWRARAMKKTAAPGDAGDAQRAAADAMLERIAGQFNFYGKLAAEELGTPQSIPPSPQPLTDEERQKAADNPGLTRSLALIAIGLRSEGVREWNYTLRGMDDRELLAAAQRACDREIWDRCINTSERTRSEIDMAQRFPTPFRNAVVSAAREAGLDPAYVYGLIRQESRFVVDARSSVGASGLMQVMPSTAKWTARKLGIPYSPSLISDMVTNLRIGTGYLKLVLDNFGGSQALAAAAYNAGPNRPRAWREGPTLEVAAWAENIPFGETREYVKRVLSNAAYYGALLTGRGVSLKSHIDSPIGPASPDVPVPAGEQLP